jgi:hypothetical protein
MNKDYKETKSNTFYTLLGVVKRAIWFIGFPIYCIYMMIPIFWIFNIPYWVITGRDLMDDFSKIYQN